MTTEANKARECRFVEEVMNNGNVELVSQFYSLNAEEVKQNMLAIHATFPDIYTTIEDQIAEGDKVVTRWTAHGTHAGQTDLLGGIAPTGKSATWSGITITHYANGKAVEHWTTIDSLSLLQQLGWLPQPAKH